MASTSQSYDDLLVKFEKDYRRPTTYPHVIQTFKSLIISLKKIIPDKVPTLSFSDWQEYVYLEWDNCLIDLTTDYDHKLNREIPFTRVCVAHNVHVEPDKRKHYSVSTRDKDWEKSFYYHFGAILNSN